MYKSSDVIENKEDNFTEVCHVNAFGEFTDISQQLSCSLPVITVNGASPGYTQM